MERYIGNMRNAYIGQLLINNDYDRAEELAMAQDIYTPILKVREAHPDEEPNPKYFNEMICDLIYDFSILNVEIASIGYEFKELIESVKNRLGSVKESLEIERERQQDIDVLCNKYTEFSEIINLTGEDFTGTFSESNGVFTAQIKSPKKVSVKVLNVEGNGYEGNKYVYKDGDFLEKTIDTSKREFIVDGSVIPLYEYSRITASNTEKNIFSLVNFDSIEAKCSITLFSPTKFNKLIIDSPQKEIVLSDVSISNDGVIFSNVIKESLEFNNTDKKYEVKNYIPGSKVICFPSTNYVKITLESKGTTNDAIAFMKSKIVEYVPTPKSPVIPTAPTNTTTPSNPLPITPPATSGMSEEGRRMFESMRGSIDEMFAFLQRHNYYKSYDPVTKNYVLTFGGVGPHNWMGTDPSLVVQSIIEENRCPTGCPKCWK